MRIKKVNQTVATVGQIVNEASDSTVDTYSCDYIDDHKKNKDKIKTVEPTMMNATVTKGSAWQCTYQYLDDHVIVGAVKLRGTISAVANPAYAVIKLNIPNFQPDTWRSFAVLQEAYGCTTEIPAVAAVQEDNGVATIKLSSPDYIGTALWKTTSNTFYVTAGFILFDIQS